MLIRVISWIDLWNTNEVEIDASGFEGHELTVTVTVGGFDPSCMTTVSKQFVVKKN